jgi:hypothetical protein
MGKQALRRHDGSRVKGAAVLREATHDPQATGSLSERRSTRLAHPCQREIGGDGGCASQIGERDELLQQASGPTEFVPEGATHG